MSTHTLERCKRVNWSSRWWRMLEWWDEDRIPGWQTNRKEIVWTNREWDEVQGLNTRRRMRSGGDWDWKQIQTLVFLSLPYIILDHLHRMSVTLKLGFWMSHSNILDGYFFDTTLDVCFGLWYSEVFKFAQDQVLLWTTWTCWEFWYWWCHQIILLPAQCFTLEMTSWKLRASLLIAK